MNRLEIGAIFFLDLLKMMTHIQNTTVGHV